MIPDNDTESIEKPIETQNTPITSQSVDIQANVNNNVKPIKQDMRGRNKPKLIIAPHKIRKLKQLAAKGELKQHICDEVGISRVTLNKALNIPEIADSINDIKQELAIQARTLARESFNAIDTNDIKHASVVQKATIWGIAVDKYDALTDNAGDNIGDGSILNGLKSADLTEFIKSGNTVKIGIVIEPNKIPPKPVE